MNQYFQIQHKQKKTTLFFFEQGEKTDTGGSILKLIRVADISSLHDDWEYVRMAGDFPVFKRKIA